MSTNVFLSTIVTSTRIAPILKVLISVPAKMDSQGMEERAQVEFP